MTNDGETLHPCLQWSSIGSKKLGRARKLYTNEGKHCSHVLINQNQNFRYLLLSFNKTPWSKPCAIKVNEPSSFPYSFCPTLSMLLHLCLSMYKNHNMSLLHWKMIFIFKNGLLKKEF